MKIRILNGLFLVEIFTILLILAIVVVPSDIARIILGLPFLLFFPGYALMSALFAAKEKKELLELIGLSSALSIAIVALIGFALNYTSWGIRVEPVLYSVAGLTFVLSTIALVRRSLSLSTNKYTMDINIDIPSWKGGILYKAFSLGLVLIVLSTMGALGYTVIESKTSETYTEFYILGLNDKAQDYPTQFTMKGDQVTGVSYDNGMSFIPADKGILKLGIVNHEQKSISYSIKLIIDNKITYINYQGVNYNQLDNIRLNDNQIWEQQIEFAPQHTGDNQELQLILHEDASAATEYTLRLNISIK